MYDVSGAANDRNVVVLNDIHIDIMDYIIPATCTDQEFRTMWADFEWENRVGWFIIFQGSPHSYPTMTWWLYEKCADTNLALLLTEIP